MVSISHRDILVVFSAVEIYCYCCRNLLLSVKTSSFRLLWNVEDLLRHDSKILSFQNNLNLFKIYIYEKHTNFPIYRQNWGQLVTCLLNRTAYNTSTHFCGGTQPHYAHDHFFSLYIIGIRVASLNSVIIYIYIYSQVASIE